MNTEYQRPLSQWESKQSNENVVNLNSEPDTNKSLLFGCIATLFTLKMHRLLQFICVTSSFELV